MPMASASHVSRSASGSSWFRFTPRPAPHTELSLTAWPAVPSTQISSPVNADVIVDPAPSEYVKNSPWMPMSLLLQSTQPSFASSGTGPVAGVLVHEPPPLVAVKPPTLVMPPMPLFPVAPWLLLVVLVALAALVWVAP